MEKLFEILKEILPVIITGIFTFLVTKYTYNNDRPLDKLEITYNRIYYPLYKLIKDADINDISTIIDKTKNYINKYDKYVDKSTIKAFNSLCQCNTDTKKKEAFQIFKDNIYNRNSYLRRRLGYLEPSILQLYTYSSNSEKSTIRILIEMCVLYISTIFISITKGKIQVLCLSLSITFLVIFIIECICKVIMCLYYKLKK